MPVLGASAKIVISSMSLADLASLASSVAVVVSLLFLGQQIRQSNRNQRSLMQQGRSARNVEVLSRWTRRRIQAQRPAQFAQHAPAIHRGRERSAPEVARC